MRPRPTIELLPAAHVFRDLAADWDRLAERTSSPFLTSAWLGAWTTARARTATVLAARDTDGSLVAGACVRRLLDGTGAAADVHTGAWTVVGNSAEARQVVWEALAESARLRVRLGALPAGTEDEGAARRALEGAGFRVAVRRRPAGPRIDLPDSAALLLSSVSRNLRSQYRRRLRGLERLGPVRLRTTTAATPTAEVEQQLEAFLALEAAGWKSRRGTAILSRPDTAALYRTFAHSAAASGMLRLQLLEVGGRAVAGDLSVAFGGGVHMLKTGYDEALAALSPGLVLRGLSLETAVADGYRFYDMLGGPEQYKLRWGGTPRQVVVMNAYRGALSRARFTGQEHVRPRLRRSVQVGRELRPVIAGALARRART